MKRTLFLSLVLATSVYAEPITAKPLPSLSVEVEQTEAPLDDLRHFEQVKDREEAAARELIGEPLIARSEGLGAMWTYQQPDCVLFVFFTSAAPGEPHRLSAISSGPRRRGDRVPPADECLAAQMATANPEPAHKGTHRPGG